MALPHSKNIFDYPPKFQFGQAGAPCGGSSCCTDTCIQMIVNYYKDINPSLSEIRRKAQAKTNFSEGPCTGINHIETLNALEAYGIGHYKAGFGVDRLDVWRWLAYGPVIVGVYYGSYPEAKGKCGPGPQAEYSGKTDCPFRGSHAVLAIGRKWHNGHRDYYIRDPDHDSASRPERPKYDIITGGQLQKTMFDLKRYTAFPNSYILYPTRKK